MHGDHFESNEYCCDGELPGRGRYGKKKRDAKGGTWKIEVEFWMTAKTENLVSFDLLVLRLEFWIVGGLFYWSGLCVKLCAHQVISRDATDANAVTDLIAKSTKLPQSPQ